MTIIPWLVVGALALFYLGVPLVVRRQFWASPEPGPRFVRPHQLDDDVAAALDRRGAELERLGLERRADTITEGWLPDTTIVSRYLADGARTTVALASVVIGETEDRRELHELTAFGSRRLNPDGTWVEISTTDTDEPNPIRATADVVTRLPGASAAALLASHQRSLEEHATGAVLARAPAPVDIARQDLERTIAVGTADGLLEPHPERTGQYRLTLGGAYRVAWRNLPPMLGLTKRRYRRTGQARLREIGWGATEG